MCDSFISTNYHQKTFIIMTDRTRQRSMQSGFIPLVTLLLSHLSLVHGAFFSLAYSAGVKSNLSRNRLSSLGVLNAYIDGVDGIISSSSRNIFASNTKDNNDIHTIINTRIPPRQLPNGGKITLVGSGPGDPDLLTISAHRIITDPSVMVIADRLVSSEILQLIQGECRIARKLPGCAEEAQDEIYAWVKEGLDAGKHIIRLKIGDPFVFGRGGEEVLKFREYGVEATVIPGVSAALSAPLLGSIPVTHRGVANQVVICTGYGRNGSSPELIQYHKEQTIVFLMAVGRIKELCHSLINMAGYPSKTPVAIIERAGCPDQRTIVGNMETISTLAETLNVRPPSSIVVGEVVNVLLEKDETTGETVCGLIHRTDVQSV